MAETTDWTDSKWAAPRAPATTCRAMEWLKLSIWVTAIVLFMQVVGPALLQCPALRPMVEAIEARGIEANMYFYTEVEVFYEANVNMDNTWAYPRRVMPAPGPSDPRDE
jgi:hypothetical protein